MLGAYLFRRGEITLGTVLLLLTYTQQLRQPIDRLDATNFDDRVGPIEPDALKTFRAVIVNIDYPLGLAAYNILREVAA